MQQAQHKYDLEERTLLFAQDCRTFIKKVPRTISNIEDCTQLARSSGSVPANYIEANEALGKKDFLMRVKICRKEARESGCWLELITPSVTPSLQDEHKALQQEACELKLIFNAIVQKLL